MTLSVAALVFGAALQRAAAGPPVVYGTDDRLDYHEIKDSAVRELADATAAVFNINDLAIDAAAGTVATPARTYKDAFNLAASERFGGQPVGALCSAALVAPDLVLTAGHCVRTADDCAAAAFVFGYAVRSAGAAPGPLKPEDVYRCKPPDGLIKSVREGCQEWLFRQDGTIQEFWGADWALIRLDRPVSGRKALRLAASAPAAGTPVLAIGYPSGLPVKVSPGSVIEDPARPYFLADLDICKNSSGSPVFDAATREVVGLVVRRPPPDFVREPDGTLKARQARACPDDAVEVTRVSLFRSEVEAARVGAAAPAACLPPGDIFTRDPSVTIRVTAP